MPESQHSILYRLDAPLHAITMHTETVQQFQRYWHRWLRKYRICLYKPIGVACEVKAPDDAMVDTSGGWIRIIGGGSTPAGRYDTPTCGGGGVDATGIIPGPGNGGRPEPGGMPFPGYTDNTHLSASCLGRRDWDVTRKVSYSWL